MLHQFNIGKCLARRDSNPCSSARWSVKLKGHVECPRKRAWPSKVSISCPTSSAGFALPPGSKAVRTSAFAISPGCLDRGAPQAVKPISRSRWNDGYAADSDPSQGRGLLGAQSAQDRDRGTPRDATPPTPPGIRVPYHGGSTELGLGGRIDSGKTERLEIVVA